MSSFRRISFLPCFIGLVLFSILQFSADARSLDNSGFASKVKTLRQRATEESIRARKLFDSLTGVDDMDLMELRIPKKGLLSTPKPVHGGSYPPFYPPVYPSPDPSPSPIPTPSPSPASPIPSPTVPRPNNTESAPAEEVQFLQLSFTLQADISTITENLLTFKDWMQKAIASAAGLQESQVAITSVRAGSVIVDAELTLSAGMTSSDVQGTVQKITSSAVYSGLQDKASQFGITGVSSVAVQQPNGSSSPTTISYGTPGLGASSTAASLVTLATGCLGALIMILVIV